MLFDVAFHGDQIRRLMGKETHGEKMIQAFQLPQSSRKVTKSWSSSRASRRSSWFFEVVERKVALHYKWPGRYEM